MDELIFLLQNSPILKVFMVQIICSSKTMHIVVNRKYHTFECIICLFQMDLWENNKPLSRLAVIMFILLSLPL